MNQLPTAASPSKNRQLPWMVAAGLSAVTLFTATKIASRIRRAPVRLQGKVALVTGGSRGLGLALAHELGDAGCEVALVARDEQELSAAAAELRARSIQVETFPSDITDNAAIGTLIGRVLERFGRIDVLVNDAGMIKVAPLDKVEHHDFEEAMNLMFWAPVNLTLAVLPHMRRQGGGHIVNITSVGGRVAIPHLLPYCCAKFALVGFSTGISNELDPDHIHVLTVVPGLMRTGSYLNARFKGSAQNEFAWFSLLGNLPGMSVSAEQSAQEIREALQRRQLTCTISLAAKALIQSEALLPEATHALMEAANRILLPKAGQQTEDVKGKNLNSRFGTLFQTLTSLGRTAATSLNQ
jgi:short-subunit dehydrogenase